MGAGTTATATGGCRGRVQVVQKSATRSRAAGGSWGPVKQHKPRPIVKWVARGWELCWSEICSNKRRRQGLLWHERHLTHAHSLEWRAIHISRWYQPGSLAQPNKGQRRRRQRSESRGIRDGSACRVVVFCSGTTGMTFCLSGWQQWKLRHPTGTDAYRLSAARGGLWRTHTAAGSLHAAAGPCSQHCGAAGTSMVAHGRQAAGPVSAARVLAGAARLRAQQPGARRVCGRAVRARAAVAAAVCHMVSAPA